ncbi:MAG: diguanylate cyclase [Proteobacteria bacterium]|uniref:diguanylate cyclase n=1 Tax=Aquabacterium sp. TaxID=1872578 RepID=UPI0035C671A3|nr:diguanylate cyclase [Pseudomonadota bacterium]
MVASLTDIDSGAAHPAAGTERVHELLEHGFPWMLFPADMERQFLRDGAAMRAQHFLLSGLIALLVYNGFLLADYLMARDVFWLAVVLRLLVFTPISLLVLYLFHRGALPWLWRDSPLAVDVLALLGGLGAALSLGILLVVSHSPLIFFYPVGFIVVITYGNVVQRLRFWFAAAFTGLLLVIYVASVMGTPSFPPRLLWTVSSLVLSVAAFTLSATYFLERDERRRYLLTLREKGLVQDLSLLHTRLRRASHIDALTGMHNRRHMQEHLALLWERATREASALSVLLVDIDHFKKFNDRYGNPAGDACLQQVGQALQGCQRRSGDVVGRHGGEEFMVLLPHTDAAFAVGVAERIRQAVEALNIRHESSTTALHLTVSVGVASCVGGQLRGTETLLAAADQALKQAKLEGRNRVCSLAL